MIKKPLILIGIIFLIFLIPNISYAMDECIAYALSVINPIVLFFFFIVPLALFGGVNILTYLFWGAEALYLLYHFKCFL